VTFICRRVLPRFPKNACYISAVLLLSSAHRSAIMNKPVFTFVAAACFQALSLPDLAAQTSPYVEARAHGHVNDGAVLVTDGGASGPRAAGFNTDGGRATASASYGALKTYGRWDQTSIAPFHSRRWSIGRALFRDTITINHPSLNGTTGQITVAYQFDANVTASGSRPMGSPYNGTNRGDASWRVTIANQSADGYWAVYPDGETIMEVTDGGVGTPFNQRRTFTASFVYGQPFGIAMSLNSEAYAFTDVISSQLSDAENTGTWGGVAAVRTASGATVSDYTISSATGTDYRYPNSQFPGLLRPSTIVSVKAHGTAGIFETTLPTTGTPAVESRSGGPSGDHTIIFRFADPLASVGGASVTSGGGSVSSSGVGSDAREYIVNLTGISNASTVTVTLSNVNDTTGNGNASIAGSMSVLVGDTNGDGTVNSGDALQTRSRSGQTADSTNFRSDVNIDGVVNSGDALTVRRNSGSSLSP
jgi:hypothetical protein